MKAIGRKAVFIYSGLDVILQITSVDPLEQIYYAGSDSFIPDRTLTPLVLTPRAQVKDKKGISMPSELANVAWYVGTPDEKNRVTSRTQTDDYYLDGLNLVVRKNLEVPQQIYVKAEYLDTRTKTTITIPQVVQLSISKSSEIAPAPTCSIDRPSDWSINPLKDAAIQNLSATIFKDEKAYRGAVKWNKSFNGIKSEIVKEDDFYISGQLTNSLKIDTDKLPSGALIGCENPSEEFYNKVYGINPEWDNKMQEVFENRNLLVSPIWMMGGINPDGSTSIIVSEHNRTDYIPIATGSYTCNLYDNWGDGWGVSFYKDKTDKEITIPQLWQYKQDAKFTIDENTKYIRLNKLSINLNDRVKLERGDKSTPYTPAPEDLNYRNCLLKSSNLYFNQGRSGAGYSNKEKHNDGSISWSYDGTGGATLGWWNAFLDNVHINNVKKIFKEGDIYTLSYWASGTPGIIPPSILFISGDDYKQPFGRLKDSIQKFSVTGVWRDKYTINTHINCNSVKGDYRIYKFMLCKGNNIDVNSSWTPSPEDYAPDGIIKGNYEADVPMFVKYPDTLDISMKPLPLIPEGVEELTLEVEATTSAGTLNNPAKYFDIDYYLANDEEAGVEPVKVGSGNSVKVTRNQLKERPEYYLEWDYKPRPTTLNKKQSQSMDK